MKKYLILALFAVLGTALAAPSISTDYTVTPSSINAGGTAQVIVTITNADLTTDINDLEVELTSRSSAILVTSGRASPGDVPASSTSSAAFAIMASQSAAPGTYIVEAKGTYDYGAGESSTFRVSIPITISYRSSLQIFAPDTQVTPGATENLLITINNAGKSPIRDLVITLSPSTSYIYPVGNVRNTIEVLQPKASSEANFRVRASDVATAGIQPITITVTYTDAAGTTQTDTQSIGVIVVDAGTEVVIDSIDSNLEPGKTGRVRMGVKNVGAADLENLYFSITVGTGLSLSGSNEKLMESLAVGETKYIEFEFDVSQDAEAKPVDSTLSVTYQRYGGKKQITDTKSLGVVVNGKPDLQVIDIKASTSDNQMEVDLANYGNKDADAIKVDALSAGRVFGTSFTDKIKPNKHKVFRFDMPTSPDVVIRIAYKDYSSANGTTIIQESFTLDKTKLAKAGDSSGSIFFVLVIIFLGGWWYWRKRKNDRIKIDISKYKEPAKSK